MAQIRAVLPAMAEQINFRFLWKEDHLSDYVLVICSQAEQDDQEDHDRAGPAAAAGLGTNDFGRQSYSMLDLLAASTARDAAKQPPKLKAGSSLQPQQQLQLQTQQQQAGTSAAALAAASAPAANLASASNAAAAAAAVADAGAAAAAAAAAGSRARRKRNHQQLATGADNADGALNAPAAASAAVAAAAGISSGQTHAAELNTKQPVNPSHRPITRSSNKRQKQAIGAPAIKTEKGAEAEAGAAAAAAAAAGSRQHKATASRRRSGAGEQNAAGAVAAGAKPFRRRSISGAAAPASDGVLFSYLATDSDDAADDAAAASWGGGAAAANSLAAAAAQTARDLPPRRPKGQRDRAAVAAAATAAAAAARATILGPSAAAAAAPSAAAAAAEDGPSGTPPPSAAAGPNPNRIGLHAPQGAVQQAAEQHVAAASRQQPGTSNQQQQAQFQQQQQSQQQSQQQEQQQGQPSEPGGPLMLPSPSSAAGAAAAAGPSQPSLIVHRELPVHGAVLSAMSEYFRALIQNWQGAERRLQMVVAPEEGVVAEALVEFMYTGDLPSLAHDDMLRLMRLSDKYQVKNCPAACARRFADTPMEELSLDTVCAIFDWPGFLQEAQPFAGVASKAWSKLLELFGDLEVAWQDATRRQQFLELPFKAVRKLLGSDELAVVSENTVLVALAGWLDGHARSTEVAGQGLTPWGLAQLPAHRELAELVRLQHLSPAFLGSVLKRLPVMANVATADALMAAARYAAANEATRNKLQSMPNRLPRIKVLYAPPRARSSVTRLQFEWVLELSAVKAMIAQFRNTKVTVDRYSEPHYFNGFQWQLVLQVLEPPAKPPASSQAAAPTVDVFVGTTARIKIGSSTHLPDVLYFRGQLAAREVASGDFTFVNRMESGFVCGTAGWGFRNFLRITDWDNEAALRRFFYDGKIHLRCNIDACE